MPDQTRQLVAAAHNPPRKRTPAGASPNDSLVRAALRNHPGLDQQAVLRVANQEGLSGRIGDNGHAFGPFQLNNAGGVLTGRFQGETPEQINQWAWSPQGIEYALHGIEGVAAGQHGSQAVNSIVRRFERPADPNGEVARALGASPVAAQPTNPSFGAPATGSSSSPSAFASALLSGIDSKGLIGPTALVRALQMRGGGQPTVTPSAGPTVQQGGPLAFQGDTTGLDPAFLQREKAAASAVGASAIKSISGYRDPQHNAAVGGVQGSQHTRGNADDGYALINGQWVPLGVALKPVAGRFGLRSGAVPGFFNGRPDPNHVDGGLG